MTCDCPKSWCYARADCRLKEPQQTVLVTARPALTDRALVQEAETRAQVMALGSAWWRECR